jgi:hypothetical protein
MELLKVSVSNLFLRELRTKTRFPFEPNTTVYQTFHLALFLPLTQYLSSMV